MVRLGSNHSPIALTLETINRNKAFPFRFEKMWSAYPSLSDKIKEWWGIDVDDTTMYKLAKKLKNIKMEIRKWNKMDFGNIFQSKDGFLEKLAEVQEDIQNMGYDESRLNVEKTILVDLLNIMGKEEMFWR